ncbi:MAG: hypothetical protein IKQ20_03990 [Bacteroidales bacterium]|nr:hypothetical protein [Bacteroidales bacterium]
MASRTRSWLKNIFRQGAWPQATDYSDLIDSFALVGEIPEGGGSVDRQQVVKVPAGTVGTGEAYEIAHTLGKLPCVDVYVKSGDKELYRVNDVKVTLIGTTKVVVNVNDRTIPDVRDTGMTIVLN